MAEENNETDFSWTNKHRKQPRMLQYKIKVDTRLERLKRMRSKHRTADLESLKGKKREFQI